MNENITLDVPAGSGLIGTIHQAHSIASQRLNRLYGRLVNFTFNGLIVSVKWDSDPDLIYRDCSRALSGFISSDVGPYPKPVLTDEEKENDSRIEAENQQRRNMHQAEVKARQDVAKTKLEQRLVDAPLIDLADEAAWQEFVRVNSADSYSNAVAVYAERSARLMQIEMSKGKALAEVADDCFDEADIDGITGYMYSFAVHILRETWKHGEALKQWQALRQLHN